MTDERNYEMTDEEERLCRRLKRLARDWPKGYWLITQPPSDLALYKGHPAEDGILLEIIQGLPADGIV